MNTYSVCYYGIDLIQAIILGIIQGITEFLPVSSSGHLALGQLMLGFEHLDQYIIFDLVCHLGTLFAIFLVFSDQIVCAFKTNRIRLIQLFLAMLPLFPLAFLIKPIKAMFNQPEYLGYFFLFTAFVLYMGIRFGSQATEETLHRRRWRDALTIGFFQAVAIFPGISRSGSTISAARVLGWSSQDALVFSFLLAIPTILGAIAFELLELIRHPQAASVANINFVAYFFGFITSFVVGYLSLLLLMRLAIKNKFMYFVWYCLIIGIITTYYFS